MRVCGGWLLLVPITAAFLLGADAVLSGADAMDSPVTHVGADSADGAPYFDAPSIRRARSGRSLSRRRFRSLSEFNCATCSAHGVCRCNDAECATGSCDCANNNALFGFWQGTNCDDCVLGYAGPSCTKECEGGSCNACNGNGVCMQGVSGDGSCACFLNAVRGFWSGAACDTCAPRYFGAKCRQTCPGVNEADGRECYGRGFCRSDTGTCICDKGWGNATGCLDCDDAHFGSMCTQECAGYTGTAPCSGHGRCFNGTTGNGTCVCDPGWGTADCSRSCPNACSGRGECLDGADRSAQCLCPGNWAPPDCSECVPNMTGPHCDQLCLINSTSNEICSSSGLCMYDGANGATCQCVDGFIGIMCGARCPGSPPCSGHGTCVESFATGVGILECRCFDDPERGHWSGASCDRCVVEFNNSVSCNVSCPVGGNDQICSGHGTCTNGTCQCVRDDPDTSMDYCGEACEIASLYTGVPCSFNCIGCEAIYCHRKFSFGPMCENTCPGVDGERSYACSGWGHCDEGRQGSGRCVCAPAATGSACQLQCPRRDGDVLPCSGPARGNCSFRLGEDGITEHARCDCHPGFTGDACEGECPFVAGVACAGHGSCNAETQACMCNPSWTGKACNVPCLCDQEYGSCNATKCSLQPSFLPCDSCECVGNFIGLCDRCRPGYQGVDCSGQCVHGVTVGRTCQCALNYSLPDCSKKCAEDETGVVCGGHGRCSWGSTNLGECVCATSFFGTACTVYCTRELCAGPPYNFINPQCNSASGVCECLDDSTGHFAIGSGICDVCGQGFWGPSCTERCECSDNGWCDMNTGECNCFSSDELGHWRGATCSQCAEGFIGQRCERRSVLITRLVGRNITRSDESFTATNTLALGIEHDDTQFDGRTVIFAGGEPLWIVDISNDEMSLVASTSSSSSFSAVSAFGCANQSGEIAHVISTLSGIYFVVQPTPNCSRGSIRIVLARFSDGELAFPPLLLQTPSVPNPLFLSDHIADLTTRARVVAAVSQGDADPNVNFPADKAMLLMVVADFDSAGRQLAGGRIIRYGLNRGTVDIIVPGGGTTPFFVTDIALSPLTVASDQLVAVSGFSEDEGGTQSWEVEAYGADSLTPFFLQRSIKGRARCFPRELHDGVTLGDCAKCRKASKIRFFGDSIVIAMEVDNLVSGESATLERTTVLVWLSVAQHISPNITVSLFDEQSSECLDGRIVYENDGTRNFVFDGTSILLSTILDMQCSDASGAPLRPCDHASFVAFVAPTDLENTLPTAMIIDMKPGEEPMEPQSGVVYVAVRGRVPQQLSSLVKFSLQLSQFGVYGVEELRLTSDSDRNDIPEVFSALAIAPQQRLLYALVTGVSRIRLASFLLYEVHTLQPNIADQRGGTNVTVLGLGFAVPPGQSVWCAFEEMGTIPVRYELVAATSVSYHSVMCRAPPQNTTSLASACEGQRVEISLYGGHWLTHNRQSLQRVQRPFLQRGGVSPERGSMNIPVVVTVRGAGFIRSEWSRCKFFSDNPLATEVLFSPVTYRSPNEVECFQPVATEASYDTSYIDVSLDGQLFSVETPPEYQIVGEATNILVSQSTIELKAAERTPFVAKVWVVDSQNHQLGPLDTESRRINLFANTSESPCDEELFDWRRPDDGYPWPPCRNFTLNSSAWGGSIDNRNDGTRLYFNYTAPGTGELTFSGFFFDSPRTGRVTITFSGHNNDWFSTITLNVVPGDPHGLAIANLQDFGSSDHGSKFFIQRQSPLSQIDIIFVDNLGNIIEHDVQRFQVGVDIYFIRDDNKERVGTMASTPVFRIENNRITFPDIYLEYLHGADHFIRFTSAGLRPVTTPAIRTQQCAMSEFKVPMSSDCRPCPPQGAQCDGTENITVLPGFWRSSGSRVDIYECRGGASVCPGSAAPNGSECADGHMGPMCTLCAPDFGRSGPTSCSECEDEDKTITYVVLIAFAFLVVVLGWVTFTLRKAEVTDASIVARTVVNHLQAAGELGEFSTQWSPFLQRLFDLQAAGSSPSLSGVQALDCLLKQTSSSYTTVFAIYMSLPGVAVALGIFVFIVVRVLRLKPVITKALEQEVKRDIEALGANARTAILLHRYPLYMVLITSLCVTMFTVYQMLITQSTSVLRCREFVVGYREEQQQVADGMITTVEIPVTARYMLVDMALSCDSEEYQTLYTTALIFAVIYGLGIPAAFVFGYKFVNARIAKPELTKLMFTFLIGGYKEQFWFWQAIIMVRKLVIVLVIIFIENRQLQSYCGMWTMSAALILQIWFNPNEKTEHNRVEALSLAIITVTLNLSLLYFWPDMPDAGKGVLTAVLIVLTIGALVMFCVFLVQPMKDIFIEIRDDIMEVIRELTAEEKKDTRPRFTMPELYLSPDEEFGDEELNAEIGVDMSGQRRGGSRVIGFRNRAATGRFGGGGGGGGGDDADVADFTEVEMDAYEPPTVPAQDENLSGTRREADTVFDDL